MMEKSKLPALGYRDLAEALGERFHASPALLKTLNPQAKFAAGEEIRVPNVAGATPSVAPAPAAPPAAPARGGRQGEPAAPAVTVTVRKSTSDLTVTDGAGKTLLYAPVTTGSEHDPLPIGDWKVNGVQKNPTFHYNPDLFWDADPSHAKAKIPAGPNNPVGVVWVDISRPHYGLHGTPEPVHRRQDLVARLRAADQLGRAEARRAGAARHESGLRRITMATHDRSRRPDFKYLVASGLLGFVLGAFVVASLGNMPARAPRPR